MRSRRAAALVARQVCREILSLFFGQAQRRKPAFLAGIKGVCNLSKYVKHRDYKFSQCYGKSQQTQKGARYRIYS